MFDRKTPLSLAVEAEMKRDGVMDELRRIAKKFSRSNSRSDDDEDAKDLLARSLVRVIDPEDDPWRPGAHSFLAHMYVTMRQVGDRQRRKRHRGYEVLDGGVAQETTANDAPRPDEELERGRSLAVLRQLGERVLERLGSDLLARQLYETALTEDLGPSAEAARFRRSPAEIKAAHDRLRYHARIVLEEWNASEWNASEARRMSTLKERATTRSEEETP